MWQYQKADVVASIPRDVLELYSLSAFRCGSLLLPPVIARLFLVVLACVFVYKNPKQVQRLAMSLFAKKQRLRDW